MQSHRIIASKPLQIDLQKAFPVMEQRDQSTVNNSGDKPLPQQNPSVNRQGLPDSETTNVNHSGNPITRPETQSSSRSNHQNLDPPSPPPPPKIPSEDDVSNHKFSSVPGSPSNCSDDDFPISYMPDPRPAIQNPPVQVMKRAEQPDTPLEYRIPSRVFARTNTGAPEWSLPSNESLFSIHMGNMSFSRELEWLNSEMSGDPLPPLTSYNNNGGNTNNQIQHNKPNDPSTSNQKQANNLNDKSEDDQTRVNKPKDDISTGVDQSQANKFNDMSQSVGKFHQDCNEMTEAKAAETMRQVIMESSGDYDLSSASVASRVDGSHHNNGPHHNNANDASRHSDCSSAKSFAFNLRPEGGKSQRSPRGFQERSKQKTQTQTGTESSKASTRATKSSSSNALYKWLCCFACCIR